MPIKIAAKVAAPLTLNADLSVIGVYAQSKSKKGSLLAQLSSIDGELKGAVSAHALREEFTAKKDQVLSFSFFGQGKVRKLILIGLGEGPATAADARTLAARAARFANNEKAARFALYLPPGLEARLRSVAEGIELGAYRFTKYFTGDRRPKADIAEVQIGLSGKVPATARTHIELGQAIGRSINLSRDLSNEPPNAIYPAALAAAAERMAKSSGLRAQIFDHKEILRRGMLLIDAVGRGSVRDPRFVHLSYAPRTKAKKRFVFVGKGVTFDTGGISIKPAAGMHEMKHDMSGAANIVGLMAAVAALKPDVEVHGLIAAAENMPDGNAYRPGDIWKSLDGKTVEIVNTDAEGRLLLADALAYGRALKPDYLIDNATLTGACLVALGASCTGFYATNDTVGDQFARAAASAGESMWRMPLLEDLRDQIRSDVADVKQTGDRYGGSITAALFLREFIGDTKNWVHADIAGPAATDRPSGWNQAKGATGHGILTFLSLIEAAAVGH
jgi:leucyl aminopeptidase